ILHGVAVITFTVCLCLFHHSSASASASLVSSLTLSRPAKGGGFRGCVLWHVGVDFAAFVFVLEPGVEVICFVFEILLN
ncbi:hypothetical protein CISIN_1g0108561mg, partial [Citrus sinensis]